VAVPVLLDNAPHTIFCGSQVASSARRLVLVVEPGDELSDVASTVVGSVVFRGPPGTAEEE
jgi:hypothetical protein